MKKNAVLSALSMEKVCNCISASLAERISTETTVARVLSRVDELNSQPFKTDLTSPINESRVIDSLLASKNLEAQLANIVLLLALLSKRYGKTDAKIRSYGLGPDFSDTFSNYLSIHSILPEIRDKSTDLRIGEYLGKTCTRIINQHMIEAMSRFSSIGTKNWIFTEEDDNLYFARNRYVDFQTHDNRWHSMRSLLNDLGFVSDRDGKLLLTKEGIEWLNKIG